MTDAHLSGTIRTINLILQQVALVMVLYRSNRKVSNTMIFFVSNPSPTFLEVTPIDLE